MLKLEVYQDCEAAQIAFLKSVMKLIRRYTNCKTDIAAVVETHGY